MLQPSSLAALLVALVPATAVAEMPTAEQLAFFENKVRPVLSARCFECHSQSAKELKGGLKLDRRESILKGGETGPALVPGDRKSTRLNSSHGMSSRMPSSA